MDVLTLALAKNHTNRQVVSKMDAINAAHFFADDTARDAYFVANPTELIDGLFVSSGDVYQMYNGVAWATKTPVSGVAKGVYDAKVLEIDTQLADDAQQFSTNAIIQQGLTKVSSALNQHIYPARYSGVANATNTKVLLLKYATMTPGGRFASGYSACKRILEMAKIPYDEKLVSDSPSTNLASTYSLILVSYAVDTDLALQPEYFDGTLGVPVIVAAGGYGWTGATYHAFTHTGALSDGTHAYKMPGGYDYYTAKAERYCNSTIYLDDGSVTRIIYDDVDATKCHVWEVQGVSNKTLWCANYMCTSMGPWILYYIKMWGGYDNALPLPICMDMDDINQVTTDFVAEVAGLQDLYDWCKSVGAVITSGIKTDQMLNDFNGSNPAFGPTTEQTAFCLAHQDVFIPIVHDHNYGTWGGTATFETLKTKHLSRLDIIRRFGFAVPDDMWGYVFEPLNQYNENAIAYWKTLGMIACRDAGAGAGVYSSDGTTAIPEAERISLASPMFWVNANQFVPQSCNNVAETVAFYATTEAEWYGFACSVWVCNSADGMPSSTYKDNTGVNMPSAGTLQHHGNNVNGDNPLLVGLKLGDGIKKAFPGTCYYTHPALIRKMIFLD